MRGLTFGLAVSLALVLVGCQRKDRTAAAAVSSATEPAPAAPQVAASEGPVGAWQETPLGRDLDRICNVVERAGAQDLPDGEQLMATLSWLPKNIESDAGREFLASIANLQGAAKADALDAGARRVGLPGCPTAELWRQ